MGNPPKPIATLLVALLMCAACSAAVTPTPTTPPFTTPTLRLSTHAGPLVRATLPPTWTETPTPLPTLTPTPTPITPTATLTPVPSLDELCASFSVDAAFEDGHTFRWNESIAVLFGTTLSAVRDPATQAVVPLTVRWLATHALSGENLGVELQGGELFGMELPVNRLPRPGYYGWSVAIYGDGIGEQCKQGGYFFVFRSGSDRTPTDETAPETQPSADLTDEAAPETQPSAESTDETTALE